MKNIYYRLGILFLMIITGNIVSAQVKIGGEKASAPHPSASLELSDSARGFLMPRMTKDQMNAIKMPANGLLVYNTSDDKIYVYRHSLKEWKEIITAPLPAANMINPEDSSEWVYDADLSRVYLRRGLLTNDTIFFSPVTGNMNFTDRYTYTNSQGSDFIVDLLGGKFNFKATASSMTDSNRLTTYTTSVVKEVDNVATNGDSHSGMLIATTVNPKATQVVGEAQGANISTIHAGQDTVYILAGLDNTATVNGNGYTEEVWGINNTARISTNSHNNVLNMYGMRNTVTRSAAATGRINGNVYGYLGSLNGLSDKVDGTMYGIFLGNVQNGTTRRNYGIFTSRGLNRFGDSVLVTDNFFTQPRAVFDINSTSAMIMPNGTTAQRPLTNVQGMMRYNSTTNGPEYNNGLSWLSFGSGGGEWEFDGINKVRLARALALGDSIFYQTQSHHFIFGDRSTYTNSLGSDFLADQLGGKFTFKSTASSMTDSTASSYTTGIIKEVDNANTNGDFHSGMLIATTINPKATQVTGQAQGLNVSTIHAGQDTAYLLSGIDNTTTVNGNGYTEQAWGMSNLTRISTNSHNDIAEMFGMRNNLSRSAAATGRITGNLYGYFSGMSGFSDKVDGTMYGIFLSNVQNGATRRNYSIFTNKGLNRFGDSVVVSDNFASFPRAVFDINSTSAMIMPNGSTAQRPLTNVQGMMRYNNTTNSPEYNNGLSWLSFGSGGGEWDFDGINKVRLSRALALGDSIFYQTQTHHFIFGDRSTYTNSLGSDFLADQLGGKFTFKSTASSMTDSIASSYTTGIIKEVDNANTNGDFHSGMLIATTINPKATQVTGQAQGLNVSTIHAGQDTAYLLSGIDNTTTVNGNGYTEQAWGISNLTRISTNSHNDVAEMYGIRNNLSRSAAATGRVTGNLYGYFSGMSGFSDKVDGTMYGIFLSNVQNGTTRRNYGIFTNKGLNRFGDSVVVSDNFATQPRAIFDINSTSAMIMPNGSTAQRPLTNVQGMLRYNSTTNNPEYNNGASWVGIGSSSEWDFDGTNKVRLTRGLALGDSIFFHTQSHHFIFSDRTTYTNSQGNDFLADQLGGKYTFKSTASKTADVNDGAVYTTSVINEVDNSGVDNDFHSGMLVATTINPKATQVTGQAQGINVSTIHAGQDTAYILSGIDNVVSANGNGYTEELWGIANTARLGQNSHGNVMNMYGVRSSVSRLATATGRINGNAYGYFGSFGGLSGNVDGTIYGIFLGNVQNGTTRRNYALYTNAGLNRFGDSVLITNAGFTQPRAILDINATSAMIMPNGSTAQRPATNVQGMFRYNSTTNNPEYNNGTTWVGISTDEWNFNTTKNRVEMSRPLALGDSIFYSNTNRHFVFGDRTTYTNSLGSDFTVDQLGGKFTFKSTASKSSDAAGVSSYTLSVVNEVDNASVVNNDFYSGLLVATTVNPKANQAPSQVQGANVSSIHAGTNAVQVLSGIDNTATVNGLGYTDLVYGFANNVRFNANARNNIGNIYGFRNSIVKVAGATGLVTGNVYGYYGTQSGFAGRINGTLYGIYLNNMTDAGPRKNYALYTNAGLNRFGDSVLITNTGSTLPRAVVDINATSSMIVPTGNTAQRPVTGVTGMVRYNSDNGGTLETFNGTSWNGIIRNTQNIDVPNISANGNVTVTVTVPGATVGSAVNVSPSTALPAAVVIAWARVSAANTVEIRFNNVSAPGVNPSAQDYYIRVIQ